MQPSRIAWQQAGRVASTSNGSARARHRATISVSGQWRDQRNRHASPATAAVLERLADMRIPLDLTGEKCGTITAVIGEVLRAAP